MPQDSKFSLDSGISWSEEEGNQSIHGFEICFGGRAAFYCRLDDAKTFCAPTGGLWSRIVRRHTQTLGGV